MVKLFCLRDISCCFILQVKPYPVQPNCDVVSSLGANIVQPGQLQQPHRLTNFLDVVSTSALSVIEEFILKDGNVVHQKGIRNSYV